MSTNKRSSATAEQTHGNKRVKPTIAADTVDVNAVMTTEGPIVTAVVLRTNGECEELVLDMSPKLQLVAKELRGSVGFLGQWESLEVVLIMRADQDDSSFDMNSHKLQPPFDEAEVRGDILLMRNDEEGIPANFTATEYHAFQKLVIPKWEPGDQDDGDDDDEVSEDEEEDNEEMDDESENESDDEEVESFLDYMLEEELAKFRTANSREPTKEELKEIDERVRSIAKDAENREGADDDDEDDDDEEEDADDEVAEQLNLFLEKIYLRLLEKFKTDNGVEPTEDEIVPLRKQAAEIADQIIAQQEERDEIEYGEEVDDEDDEEVDDDDDNDEGAEEGDDQEDRDEEANIDEEEEAVIAK